MAGSKDRKAPKPEDKADTPVEETTEHEVASKPFNPPRLMTDYFPRWVVASIPDVGDVPVVVRNVDEEVAVLKKTASFKITKSAQGDTYEVIA